MKSVLLITIISIASLTSTLANAGLNCAKKVSDSPLLCQAIYNKAESYSLTGKPNGTHVSFSGSWKKRIGSGAWSGSTSITSLGFTAKMGTAANYTLSASGSGVVRQCTIDPETKAKECENFPYNVSGSASVLSF